MAKLCDLRADMSSGIIKDNAQILSIALTIDSELAEFASNAPPSVFSYTIGNKTDGTPFHVTEDYDLSPYNGCFHIYQSFWACNFWNNYRYARIIVNDLILTELRSLAAQSEAVWNSSHFRDQCHSIRDLMRQCAADICATVPYKLGAVVREEGRQHPSPIKTGAGFTLLFPLYVAAVVDGYPSPTCTWIMKCFNIIGRVMGIDTALALIAVLPTERGMVSWVDRMDYEEELRGRSRVCTEVPDETMA